MEPSEHISSSLGVAGLEGFSEWQKDGANLIGGAGRMFTEMHLLIPTTCTFLAHGICNMASLPNLMGWADMVRKRWCL